MNMAVPIDESSLSELVLAKRALEAELYTPEDYAVVARACSVAQALQIGIRAHLIQDTQAAFFVSLGLPGKPTAVGMPIPPVPHVEESAEAPASARSHSVNQRVGENPRTRRRTLRHSRPRDGLPEEHRP